MYKNPAHAESQLTPLERAKLKIKQEKMNSSIGSDRNGYSSRERATEYLPLRQKSGSRERSISSERKVYLEQNNAHTLTIGPHGSISIYPHDETRSFQQEHTFEERKVALQDDNDREDQMSKYIREQSSLKKIRDKVFGQDLLTRGPNDHELSVHGESDEPEDISFEMDPAETSFVDTTQDQISELAASKGDQVLSKITNLDKQKSPSSALYTSTKKNTSTKTGKIERDEKNSDASSDHKEECGIGLNSDLQTMEVAIERSKDQFLNTSIRHSSTKDLQERRTLSSHGSSHSPLRVKNPPNLGTETNNFNDYYNNDLLSHQYLPPAQNSTVSGKAIRLSDNPTREQATTSISSRQYIDSSTLPVIGTLTTNLSQPIYQVHEETTTIMPCVDNLHLAIVIREPVSEKLQKSASCSTSCSVNQLRNPPRFGTSQSLKNALRTGTDSQRTLSTLNTHNRSASKANVLDSTRSTVQNRQNQVLAKNNDYDFTLLTTQVPSKFLFRAQTGLQANLLRNLLKREQDVPICAQAFGLTGVSVSNKKRALRLFEVDSCIDEKQGHNLIGGLRKQVEWLRRKPHLPSMVDSTCNHVFLFGQAEAKKSQLMSVVNQDSFLCSLIKSEIRFMRVSFFYFGDEILLSQKSFQTKSQAKREVGMELREAYRSRDFHVKKIAMKQSTFQKSVKTEEVKAACHMVVQLDNLLIYDMAEIDSLKDPSIAKAVSADFSAMTNAILSISPFYRSQDLLKKNSATAKLGSNQFFNFLQTTITIPSKVLLLCCAVENSMPGTQAVQYCNKIRCFFRGRAENAAPQQLEQVALAAEVQSQVCENSKDMIGHKINVFRQLAALLTEVEKAKAIIEKVYTQQLLGEKQRNPIHEPVSTRKFHQLKDLVERTRDDVSVLLNELAFQTGDYYKSQLAHIKELLQTEIQIMTDKASCIKHKSASRNSSAPSRSASSAHRHNSSHQGGHSNLKKKSNQVKMHPATNPQALMPSSTKSVARSQKVSLKRPMSSNRIAGPPDRSALIFKHGQKVFEGGNYDFKNSSSATFGNLRGPISQSTTIQTNTLTQVKGCRTPSQQSGPTRLKGSLKVNMVQKKRPSSASRLRQRIKDSETRCQAAEIEYKIILQKKAEQKRLQKEHSKMLVEEKARQNSQLAQRHLSNRESRRSNRSQLSPNNPDADSMYVLTTARHTPKELESHRYHITSRHSSSHNGHCLTPINQVGRSFTPQMGQRQSELNSNKSNSRTDNEDLTEVAVEGDYVSLRQGRRSQREVSNEPVKLTDRSRNRTRTERVREETQLERELKDKSFERSNSRHRKQKKGYRAKDYVSTGSKSILETSVKKDTFKKSYLDTADSQFAEINQKNSTRAPALTNHSYLSSSLYREPVSLMPEGVRIFSKEAEAISNSVYISQPQQATNYKEIAELREKLEQAVSQNSEMTKARRDFDKQMTQQRLHCLEMEARVKQLEQSCQQKDQLNAQLQKDLDFRNKATPRTYTEQAYNELLAQKKQTDEVNAMILQQISQLKEAVQDFRQTEQLNRKLLEAQKEKDSKIKRLRHQLRDMQSQMQKQLQFLLAKERDSPSECQENDDKTSNATESEQSRLEHKNPKSKASRADPRIEEEVAALRAKVNVLEQAKEKFRDQTLDLKTEVRRLKNNLRDAEGQIEVQSNSQKSGLAFQDIKGMISEFKQDSMRSQRNALATSNSQQVLYSKQSSVDGRRTSAKP